MQHTAEWGSPQLTGGAVGRAAWAPPLPAGPVPPGGRQQSRLRDGRAHQHEHQQSRVEHEVIVIDSEDEELGGKGGRGGPYLRRAGLHPQPTGCPAGEGTRAIGMEQVGRVMPLIVLDARKQIKYCLSIVSIFVFSACIGEPCPFEPCNNPTDAFA
jgi:hypothetical protein